MTGETLVCMLRAKKERRDEAAAGSIKTVELYTTQQQVTFWNVTVSRGLEIKRKFALAKCERYKKYWQKDTEVKGTFWDTYV